MAERKRTFVALLRGINVGGKHKVAMSRLRAVCEGIGCGDVRTYIQSGNVVLTSAAPAEILEARLERAIDQEFRFSIPVVVRSASSWGRYVAGNPFPDEARDEGKWVLLALSKLPPQANAALELQRRAAHGERVLEKGDAIWIHYAGGVGRSKLSPAVLGRHIGSPVTARNWRTVLTLEEMARAGAAG